VVDVAVDDRLVTAAGVLAVPVPDPVGAVEAERLHLGAGEVGDDHLGADDDPGGKLAEVFDGGFTSKDAQQRFGAAPARRGGVGPHSHLDQGRGHPFGRGADGPGPLILAVQVAFDPP
jgi:hypothetical protein